MDVKNVIQYLKNSNKYIEESLMEGFINERTIKYLPLFVLERLAISKEAQEIIINLSENNLKIISNIISYASKKNQDWIPLCSNFYQFLKNEKYHNLINELNSIILEETLIENLLFICSNSGNYFDINSINELRDLDFIRLNRNNKNSNTNDPNAILLNKYGISYNNAYNLYKRYGKDVLKLSDSKEKEFLLDIKNIIEGKGTKKNVYSDKSFIVNIDSILRNYFTKIYNDKFYSIDEKNRIGTINNIPIYDAGTEFNMSIYSFGLATNYPIPQNYKTEWNRPNITIDYMCNSIISSSNIKTSIKHCVYGFSHFGKNELALLGAIDLGTGEIKDKLNITNPFHQNKLYADVEFRIPEELINNTRLLNNEVYRSRRRVIGNKLERINPDYIVYFKKTDFFEEDSIWKESINAAKDFSIPIVIVDCEKCLISNIEKIENNLNLFENRTDNAQIVSNIIEMIYTLSVGYERIAPALLNKHFNKDKIISYLGRIIQHIDEISINTPKVAIDCIDIIINAINDEYEKNIKSPYWVEYVKRLGGKVEKPTDVIELFERKKSELEKKSNYVDVRQQKLN